MSTLSRIRYVLAANMNAALERAENPHRMLRALVREMEDTVDEAREAVAEARAEEKRLTRLGDRLKSRSEKWGQQAEKALGQDREDLARAAIGQKRSYAEQAQEVDADRTRAAEQAKRIENDIASLEVKLQEARQRLRKTPEKATVAAPEPKRERSYAERRLSKIMGRFERFESRMDHLEARIEAYDVGESRAAPAVPEDPQVEKELKELKDRMRAPATAAVS